MRSGKRLWIAAGLAICGGLLVRGELAPWVQHTAAGPAIAALLRTVPMPGGNVAILRPPAEARPALTRLIAEAPRDAMLYRLRAQEAEEALDFIAAEADWKAFAAHAVDRYAAQLAVADFYHRRGRPLDEIAVLTAASLTPDDPVQPTTSQRAWHAFERMAAIAGEEALPATAADPVFRAWVKRYPDAPDAWRKLIVHLVAEREYDAAEADIAAYGHTFHAEFEPVRMRGDLELQRSGAAAALAVYDRAFRPLWPEEMRASYFKLLEQEGALREFSGRARTALGANPADLDATARLFHYFRSQNNPAAARRVLLQFRMAKESGRRPWTADELETAAQLFEWLPDVNEAARLYYALYSLPPAAGAHTERAIAGLANLLLIAPDQPIQFGAGDLSFYKDIATVDPSPGFLNGILSLVLNGSGIRWQYDQQNAKSAAYFHRAAGAGLVALLEQRFPQSERREPLRAALVTAYATYGDAPSVIRAGREYLAAFPAGAARVSVAMQVSDALARAGRTNEEFALYDQLLRELAAKASGVPIGFAQSAPAPEVVSGRPQFVSPQIVAIPMGRPGAAAAAKSGARSDEYVQVLDKYLARLAALNRPMDALRVYRAEIDRNPNDPGLYQRLATFVEQHAMSREVEDVYTRAIGKFNDGSWHDKLARWYLRSRQSRELEALSRRVIAVFSGAELERYFGEVVSATHPDAVLSRQLNVYAHERFPEDLVFVRNLLNAYARPETRDAAAADQLLRQYWFYDANLRSQLFERLSQQGRLYPELAEVRAKNPGIVSGQFEQALAANPAAIQFAAEAEVWLSHFEAAAPAARALANAYPGRREFTDHASSLYRSLAAYDGRNTEVALTLAGYEQKADPRNPEILARMGDILADRDRFARARVFWDRMPLAQPARADGYLDAATVYWDYYRYDDALRWITAARRKFSNPTLFAYQAGAIYEGKRDYPGAIRQYVAGALDGEEAARRRLLRLGNRAQTRDLVERATAAVLTSNAPPEAVSLRIAVLGASRRRPELDALLRSRVEVETSPAELTKLQETARRLGFDTIEARAAERMVAITHDPVDRMRLAFARARLLESKKEIAAASAVVDALYRQNPLILGVIRGAVDFHVRNRQTAAALDVLLGSAKRARSDLAEQFTLEAARVATSAGEFDRARTLLSGLLSADPVRAEYLAAMADTYLQAKDDRGFRDFEIATIARLKASQLTPADRMARIASIRRALIPALDRLHDSAGAIDQYIAVIDSYPEDEALTREAATYVVAHGQSPRLMGYYRKTIGEAPRDYRWPIVLGRIETVAEDYPAAIADYERAIRNRPDRADIVEAKARLEERLMRFDDAFKSYTLLYELTYRDPQWMIKVAELHARSGRRREAVSALESAIIGARTETADADFAIAERLESWHILPDALAFAERGAARAGADLLKTYGNANIYARIVARARRMDLLIGRFGGDPNVEGGVASAAGQIVAETYTPEEKVRLEQLLIAQRPPSGQARSALVHFVQSAGLVDLEARWRLEAMSGQGVQIDARLATLQAQRGVYGEWAHELEQYAAAHAGQPVEAAALNQAAAAYRSEGDVGGELRVLRRALARNALGGEPLDRYLHLLLARQPDDLLALARSGASDDIRNRAAQVAISADRSQLAYDAVRARGNTLPPVWTSAFSALTGHYLNDHTAAIDGAFQTVLDTRPIGERLRQPRTAETAILGRVWFYYGARYGEHLAGGGRAGDAEPWLPATVEAAPENAGAYLVVGDWYAANREPAKALARYDQALELDPDRGDAHDHAARLLWTEGRHAEAITRWKAAIATFVRIQSRGVRVPEPFWGRVALTFTHIGECRAVAELRGDMAHLLVDYERRNHEYRFRELFDPAARASVAAGESLNWLAELGRSSAAPEFLVESLLRTPGVSQTERIAVQRELVAAIGESAGADYGDAREYARARADDARLGLITMLLDTGDVNAAAAEWRRVPPAPPSRNRWDRDPSRDRIEVRLAVANGALPALLDRYRAERDAAPPADTLRDIAAFLRQQHQDGAARSLLAFLYDRELRNGQLEAPNFLGLAEVRLQEGDTNAAVALLNRMALVLPDGFETLTRSAELLRKYGKQAQAIEFLRRRLQAAGWDSEARLALGSLLGAGSERDHLLAAAVADTQAAYKIRADAARLAGAASGAGAGTELALLAQQSITPEAASKPYQVEARIVAARGASDDETKLRLWRGARTFATQNPTVYAGLLRAALAARRDSLALAVYHQPFERPGADDGIAAGEREDVLIALAGAAERLDDLASAQSYLQSAILLAPPDHRGAMEAKVKSLAAEQRRRAQNTPRQPVIQNAVEQDRIVRPGLPRSAQ